MDKREYLAQLASHLKDLANDEFEDAMHYVEEYFDEAGIDNEQRVIDELGSPAKYAAQIKASSTIKENIREPRRAVKPSSGIKTVWYIIAGICALPIALPLLAVVVALIFAFLAIVFAIIVTIIAITFAAYVSAIPLFISSFPLFAVSVPSGFMALGASIVLLGIAIFVTSIVIMIFSHFIPWVIKVLSNLFNSLKGGRRYERQDRY